MNEPLWRWSEMVDALSSEHETTQLEAKGPDVNGITFDSRMVEPDDLFVALPGDPGPGFQVSQRSDRDGHNFIDAAVARGAVAILTHDGQHRSVAQLAVADTLDGLRQLARFRRGQLSVPIVAITGSSGKTTGKTFLRAALGAHASEGSFNNHLGVPLSLATMPKTAAYGVFEIGTNHPGEIAPLSRLVEPEIAVLLNVHRAHVGHFSSLDALAAEKLSITAGLRAAGTGGVLVVDEEVQAVASPDSSPRAVPPSTKIVRFGRSKNADVRLLDLVDGRARYTVFGKEVVARVPGGGQHRALTLAAVLAVVHLLGQDLDAATDLADALVPQGRGNEHFAAGRRIIDDSYNANPASMAAGLTTYLEQPVIGRRLAVLGEMLELGAQGPQAHAEMAAYCADLDGLWLVGAGMQFLAESLRDSLGEKMAARLILGEFETATEPKLLQAVSDNMESGDSLLVKGSRGTMWQAGFVPALLDRLSLAQ